MLMVWSDSLYLEVIPPGRLVLSSTPSQRSQRKVMVSYFCQAGVFDFSVSDVVSQVGWLVIGYVLPGDAHTVDVVVHEGGYAVLGGGCGGEEHQCGGVAPVPQNDFFPPISE